MAKRSWTRTLGSLIPGREAGRSVMQAAVMRGLACCAPCFSGRKTWIPSPRIFARAWSTRAPLISPGSNGLDRPCSPRSPRPATSHHASNRLLNGSRKEESSGPCSCRFGNATNPRRWMPRTRSNPGLCSQPSRSTLEVSFEVGSSSGRVRSPAAAQPDWGWLDPLVGEAASLMSHLARSQVLEQQVEELEQLRGLSELLASGAEVRRNPYGNRLARGRVAAR